VSLGCSGAEQTTLKGTQNGFAVELAADGKSKLYGTYLGGGGTDAVNAIAVDLSGNAYVDGSTTSTNFPTTSGAWRTTNAGGPSRARMLSTARQAGAGPVRKRLGVLPKSRPPWLASRPCGGRGREDFARPRSRGPAAATW
jgi:hypothetical protein